MGQAKSRLSTDRLNELRAKHAGSNITFHKQNRLRSVPKSQSSIWQKYLTYLPTFFIGLVLLVVIGVLLTNIRPAQIANLGFYHSYWPLLLLVLGAVFFIFSFVLQNTRRGLLVSLLLTTTLFLKLQSVVLTSTVLVTLIGIIIGLDLFFKIVIKR